MLRVSPWSLPLVGTKDQNHRRYNTKACRMMSFVAEKQRKGKMIMMCPRGYINHDILSVHSCEDKTMWISWVRFHTFCHLSTLSPCLIMYHIICVFFPYITPYHLCSYHIGCQTDQETTTCKSGPRPWHPMFSSSASSSSGSLVREKIPLPHVRRFSTSPHLHKNIVS